MEKDYEKILEIMQKKRELENKVFEENKKFIGEVVEAIDGSYNRSSSKAQEELRDFINNHQDEIKQYNECYSILSKKITDKIDGLVLNSSSTFTELTKEAIMDLISNGENGFKIFDIFNRVMRIIDEKEYYLDYSKYDELAVGLPYVLEFIKLNKTNQEKFFDKEDKNDRELSGVATYIVKRMVEIIDALPIGTTNTFYELLSNNIIEILSIDMNDLIECIYDCLRYRDYYLDFSKYHNEEYQWYIKNKPTLNFIKINDPEKNYLTIQKHIDEVKEKAAKLNEEHEKELARIPTLTKEQLFKEMDKTGAELKQTIEELKKSAENFSNIQIGNDDEQ